MTDEFLIRTIEDMEKVYYSQMGMGLLNPADLLSPFVAKADAPITTGVTGVFQATLGMQAWVQLNMEANTFGVLPKVPWARSGFRVITTRAGTLPYGGTGEAGSLADTIKPTFATVSTTPKTVHVTFEVSEVHEFLSTEADDDTTASMSDLRTYMATEFKENINKMLNTQGGTLASNNIESLDRMVGSYAEVANCKENDESTSFTASDLDPWSSTYNRDGGATWLDAYVNYSSTSGSVRSITDAIIQTIHSNVLTNGGNPTFWQTGYDCWNAINQLYDPAVRYNLLGQATIQPSVNGIKTLEGHQMGTRVATLLGYPVILSKDTVQDTGGISRIYLLDTSNPEGFDFPRLFIKVAKPVQYFEAGMNQGTPFAVSKLSNKGLYRIMGELICTYFKGQGKGRDLKA